MPKVARARKCHRQIPLVRRRDYFRIPHRATGLNDRRRSRRRHGVESVEAEVRWLSDLIAAERTAGQKSPMDNHPTENA